MPPIPKPDSIRFRSAGADDAEQIAVLHADSWRRYYWGAYADLFLDGDVVADRRSVWSARLATPADTDTILAEQDDRLVGFIHVMFDDDPKWAASSTTCTSTTASAGPASALSFCAAPPEPSPNG